MQRKERSSLKSILILCVLLISLAGCSWFKQTIYVPDPSCIHNIEERDRTINVLLRELQFKDEQLQDCLDQLGPH